MVDFSFSPIALCAYSVPMLCHNYLDVCPTPLWARLLPDTLFIMVATLVECLLWAGSCAHALHAFYPVFPVLTGICLISN